MWDKIIILTRNVSGLLQKDIFTKLPLKDDISPKWSKVLKVKWVKLVFTTREKEMQMLPRSIRSGMAWTSLLAQTRDEERSMTVW